jgi:hypothetical protein
MTSESCLLAPRLGSGISKMTGGPTPLRQEAWTLRSATSDGLIHSMDEATVPRCGDLDCGIELAVDAKAKNTNKTKTVVDMLSIRFKRLADS